MQRYLDVLTIKSKDEQHQIKIISDTAEMLSNSSDIQELRQLSMEEIDHSGSMANEDVVALWILVTYAADIGTIPYSESRQYHFERLRALTNKYKFSFSAIQRLSVHGDFALGWFDKHLSKG